MRTLHFALIPSLFCILSATPTSAQSSWNENLKNSAFANDDLAKVQAGQILGKRNTLGINGVMSVQNCFVVPRDPAHVAQVLLSWNPTSYSELGVMIHQPISRPVVPENFGKLVFDPGKSPVKFLIDKSARQTAAGGSLSLSKSESERLVAANDGPNALALGWRDILVARVANYQTGGIANALPYENTSSKVSLQAEIQKLVKAIPGVVRNFGPLLTTTFNNPGGEKQAESYYWEMLQVQREATLLLGAMFQVSDPSGKIQVSDFQYYVSNTFSASLILYDLIPVTIQGQPGTLVWRSDFVFIPSSITGSGMEQMATENILLLEVQKSIKRLQKDAS